MHTLDLKPSRVADNLLRVPAQGGYDIHPADGLNHDLGHTDAPIIAAEP